MKKLILSSLMAMFVVIGLTSMMDSQPIHTQCSDACTAAANLGVSHGDCVSYCTTCNNPGQGNESTCTCKYVELITGGDWSLTIVKNFGQCVKYLNQNS